MHHAADTSHECTTHISPTLGQPVLVVSTLMLNVTEKTTQGFFQENWEEAQAFGIGKI